MIMPVPIFLGGGGSILIKSEWGLFFASLSMGGTLIILGWIQAKLRKIATEDPTDDFATSMLYAIGGIWIAITLFIGMFFLFAHLWGAI